MARVATVDAPRAGADHTKTDTITAAERSGSTWTRTGACLGDGGAETAGRDVGLEAAAGSLSYRVTFQGCHAHAAQSNVEGLTLAGRAAGGAPTDQNLCNPKPSWNPLSLRPPSVILDGGP